MALCLWDDDMPKECAELTYCNRFPLSNAEIARIVHLMRVVTQAADLPPPRGNSDEGLQQSEPEEYFGGDDELKDLARKIYSQRQARLRHFPAAFFHEPAWDMLLALYASCDFDRAPRVSALLTYTAAPPTTALRHLAVLEHYGHIQRHPCDRDGRVINVNMTAKAHTSMSRYLTAIRD